MRKEIKPIGNSRGFTFTNQDLKTEGWKMGDIIDLSGSFVVKEFNNPGDKPLKIQRYVPEKLKGDDEDDN